MRKLARVRFPVVLLTIAAVVLGLLPGAGGAASPVRSAPVSVNVRETAGAGGAPERAVAALGGRVVRELGIVDGFSAALPARPLGALRTAAGVRSVTPDATTSTTATRTPSRSTPRGRTSSAAPGDGRMWSGSAVVG